MSYIKVSTKPKNTVINEKTMLEKYLELHPNQEYTEKLGSEYGFRCKICKTVTYRSVSNIQRSLRSAMVVQAHCKKCGEILKKQGLFHCIVCNEIKILEESAGGKTSLCKECANNSYKKYSLEQRMWNIVTKKKSSCLKNKIEFNMQHEDLGIEIEKIDKVSRGSKAQYIVKKYPTRCPVLEIELDWGYKLQGKQKDNSPSIDRIDPDKGYVSGNVRIVSNKYNSIKNNSTPEDRIKIAKYWLANDGLM